MLADGGGELEGGDGGVPVHRDLHQEQILKPYFLFSVLEGEVGKNNILNINC